MVDQETSFGDVGPVGSLDSAIIRHNPLVLQVAVVILAEPRLNVTLDWGELRVRGHIEL